MHPFLKNTRFTFETPTQTYEVQDAPINSDQVEMDIKRSTKTDGIMLVTTLNEQYIKKAKDFIINEYGKQGADGYLKRTREEKQNNNYIITNTDFIDFNSLKWDKSTITGDFVENPLYEILDKNSREDFELDRLTDINGNAIPALTRSKMAWKNRAIFLRSEGHSEPYSQNVTSVPAPQSVFITPLMTANPVSDEDFVGVFSHYYDIYNDNASVSNIFHLDTNREKHLKLDINVNVTINADESIAAGLLLIRYENGTDLDLLSYNTLVEGSASTHIVYSGTIDIDLLQGQSLALGIPVEFTEQTLGIDVDEFDIIQTEDSFYETDIPEEKNVDCISLYDAFERIVEILSPNITFKSDHITDNWANLVIFSGETSRHMYYTNEDTGVTTIAPLATVSFDSLFKLLFTINPVAFGLRMEGSKTILEVEDIGYFFDDEKTVNLGTISDLEYKINKDKVYSRIKAGYSKSGKNEDVFGYNATHTVNTYSLPANKTDNTYDATCDFRTDPTEAELCYRKQFSKYPDSDTQYDTDVFAVDCSLTNGVYTPKPYEADFSSVTGLYRKDTAYNFNLSPMNCALRHGKNFKQEYNKSFYIDGKMRYTSTEGSPEMSTTKIGGVARPENSDVLLSDLERGLYTPVIVDGKTIITPELVAQLKGGIPKRNYYKTFPFKDFNGNQSYGYLLSAKIGDEIKIELALKY